MAGDQFDEFFKRMMKYFEEIEKEFKVPKKLMEEQPGFVVKGPRYVERGSGFSISIHSNGKSPPKVEVKRFGPSGKWEKLTPEKKGIASFLRPAKKPILKVPVAPMEKLAPRKVGERIIPQYNVSIDMSQVTIALDAEGVESEDNVRVKFYPESVEIYAVAPGLNREYFCTVALPGSIDKKGMTVEAGKKQVIVRIPRHLSATR